MKYRELRSDIIEVIEDLKKFGLLDCAGGAISARTDDGNIMITVSGSARKRWCQCMEDFVVVNQEGNIVEKTSSLGPIGTPAHLAIYCPSTLVQNYAL